jgi:putative PIN family toxin of toxin-antitoxin system
VRVLLDTNGFVKALRNPDGPSGKVVRAALDGRLLLITSEYLREEILTVFSRPRIARLFPRDVDPAEWFRDVEAACALNVGDVVGPELVADPDDDPIVWAAFAGGADYLLTWDGALLELGAYRGTRIVRPEEFLKKLGATR